MNVWSVSHEPQRCTWTSPNERPEIDIAPHATELFSAEWEHEAREFLSRLFASVGARTTNADVRPIEQCARCRRDFETSERHTCIALLYELRSDEGEPLEVVKAEYPARFCPACSRRLAPAFEIDRGDEPPQMVVRSLEMQVEGGNLWIVADGLRIARRGRPNTREAGTWVSMAPGWAVTGGGPTGVEEIIVEYQGRRVGSRTKETK